MDRYTLADMFEKYYKFPLKMRNEISARTSDGHSALDFLTSDNEFKSCVINLLNGESDTLPDKYKSKYKYDCCEIYKGDHKVMRVRGWGYLTGVGALALPTKEAIKIQDEFGEYIVEKLNTVK